MKMLFCLVLVSLASFCAFGQARPGAYPWSVTFKVVDDLGQPVIASHVSVGYLQTGKIVGLTDSNGFFVATHTDRSFALGFVVNKEGYYQDYIHYELFTPGQFNDQKVAANRNSTQIIVLRKIDKPIPMYARRNESGMVLQKENEPMGFDLKAGDWVAPYGIGSHTDIMFALLHRQIISQTKFDCTLKLSFPNKGDGIMVAPSKKITGSTFKTSRTASENGYESELNLRFINTELATNVFGYFIRVETSLDEKGNVKSALYGKVSGNFKLYAGTIRPHSGMGFDYYLNPTPNDRNLEFDPQKNLSQNLKLLEGINEP
jgi:hypothetical protein